MRLLRFGSRILNVGLRIGEGGGVVLRDGALSWAIVATPFAGVERGVASVSPRLAQEKTAPFGAVKSESFEVAMEGFEPPTRGL